MSEALPIIWFVLIAVLWIGYLFLEGFDLGVGMLMKLSARTDTQRRVLLNTVGPVWDGNEVWLITALGATFAAFPLWYASLLSTLYLPMLVLLIGLIFRAVAFEWRGKVDSLRWRSRWDWAIALGSFTAAAGIGSTLALTTTGLPLNANGDRVGGAFAWFSGYAVLGAAAVVLFCLLHASAFLALKTDGEIRARATRTVRKLLPWALLPLFGWAAAVHLAGGTGWSLAVLALSVAAAVGARQANRTVNGPTREGWTFIGIGGSMVLAVASIFAAAYPFVLPSTVDPAFGLTVQNASSSAYTLSLMSAVAALGVPLVLAYQGWTYWVFRRRVSERNIPAAHSVVPL